MKDLPNQDAQRVFMYLLAASAALVLSLILLPYVEYILSGLLLAFVSVPAKNFMQEALGESLSAILTIILTVAVFVLPFVLVIGAVGGEAASLVRSLENTSSIEPVDRVEEFLPEPVREAVDLEDRLRDLVAAASSYLPSGVSSAADLAGSLSLGVFIMLFVQYYGLRDGHRLLSWLRGLSFVDSEELERVVSSTSEAVWAVVEGHALMAIAQGLLTGLGLFALGVPDAFFWTFMSVIFGFVPIVGTALVWVPASVYLAVTSGPVTGILLGVYGAAVVGGSDNVLRPYLVDDNSDLHPFSIVIGLIGGIGVFGPAGIFLGPVTFAVFGSIMQYFR
jgi:predicted PurR-regulated permease PerM